MRKYGFTLIELLAVIVILSIILVITVPQVLKVVEKSKKDSFKISAMMIAREVEKRVLFDITNPTLVDCLTTQYGVNEEDYESCIAHISYEEDYISILVDLVGKGKFKGYMVTGATRNTANVIKIST